jgi:hypothetical protein
MRATLIVLAGWLAQRDDLSSWDQSVCGLRALSALTELPRDRRCAPYERAAIAADRVRTASQMKTCAIGQLLSRLLAMRALARMQVA